MTVQAFVLLGGVAPGFGILPEGWDGVVDSEGLEWLAGQLKAIPGVVVTTKDWGSYAEFLPLFDKAGNDKIAVIGYSGGGSRATYLANSNDSKGWPRIDLMVCYDPSPKWQMLPLHANVKKAICYHNLNPMMPSLVGMLGGGELTTAASWGCRTILTRNISEQHLGVQLNSALHQATIQAVKDLIAAQ